MTSTAARAERPPGTQQPAHQLMTALIPPRERAAKEHEMPYAPVREEWVDDAACATNDPEYWFPEKGETGWYAKAVCGECLVRQQCLEYALRNEITDGIWGGLAPRERRTIRLGGAA